MTDPATGPASDWDCTAYGPEGREVNALCFFAALGARDCASLDVCRERMTAERQHLWRQIQDGAARGEPDMVFLASEFTAAEQLLGGGVIPDGGDEGNGDG
jgi:hypothetical protein